LHERVQGILPLTDLIPDDPVPQELEHEVRRRSETG
jgi:hypothetical protein